jgi:hypothetical protein
VSHGWETELEVLKCTELDSVSPTLHAHPWPARSVVAYRAGRGKTTAASLLVAYTARTTRGALRVLPRLAVIASDVLNVLGRISRKRHKPRPRDWPATEL